MSTRHLALHLTALAIAALAACTGPAPHDEASAAAHRTTQPLFNNGGFESGSFAPDWTVRTHLNNGLPNPPWPPATVADLALAAGGTNLTSIVTHPVPESQPPAGLTAMPGVPMWPKFGTATAVVNQQGQSRNVNSIRQSYTTTSADVDPADGKIHVRWVLAPILENPNHTEQQQPYFFVVLRNTTAPRAGDLFSSFNFSNSPGTPWKAQGTTLYTDWTIFDVAPGNTRLQVGDTLELEVYAAGCSLGGHWGEVYVDGFGAFFPGLSVSKSAPSQVNVDSDITYSFLVKNNTTGAVPNVIVDEVLPADTTFVSLSAPPGAVCTAPPVGGTGTVECDFGWMNPGASTTFQVTVHAFTPAAKGTATAGTATTLTDSTRTWTANQWRGYTLAITGGTGAGQQRVVASNTATQLTVASAFSPAPDATSTFALIDPPAAVGTATAANATTLTDNTKTWTANQFSGWTVELVGGTGAGQQRRIESNNNNRLTVTPAWTTTPNTSTVYVVKRPALKVVNGDYGVRGSTYARLLGPRVETAMTAGIPYTDLAITKTDGVPAVAWGGALTYTITVTNNGPLAVTNATVTDALPALLAAGASWTCVGSNGGTCNTASGTGSINHGVNLPVGGRATFTLTANVVAGAGTSSLVNAARVTPPPGLTDNFPANDEDVDVDGVGPLVALTVNKGPGAGQGSVTSSPAAIACGNGCASASANFLTGTTVTLTAVARPGDTFAGWSGGGCTGAAVSCTVTLTAATTVTANFTGMTVTGSAPAGNGTVTCAPSDVAQGGTSTCTITPDTGYGVATVTDNGTDVTSSVSGGTYTLTNVTTNHTVVVTFGPLALTPTLTAPANGTTTSDPRPTVTGTTNPNVTVTVLVDGVPVCTTTSSGTGAFSCTPSADLSNGPHVITATATNANGTTPPSSPVNITVDTVAPAAPVVTAPANGSTTNDTTPTYSGTAEAGSTVTLRVDGSAVGTVTADASGAWTFTPTTPLAEGSHSVSATAADAAGNTSMVSNTNTFIIDTTAPTAPIITGPANGDSTSTTPTIAGTAEPNSTVTVLVDGVAIGTATADGTGQWTLTPTTPLGGGAHTLTATSTDAAGNTSTPSAPVSITVLTAAPSTPTLTSPAEGALTNDSTPALTGTGTPGSTVTVTIDGAPACTAVVDAQGDFTCTPTAPLDDGPHAVTIEASNVVGASPVSPPSHFTVDTTPPWTPVVVGPAHGSRTSDTTPTVTGTGEPGSTITVRIDGADAGTTTVRPDGTWTFDVPTALALGAHTVSATAVDVAGNPSLPSNTNAFTIDDAANAPVVTTPADNSVVDSTTPALAGTAAPGARLSVLVDGLVVCLATADVMGAFSCTPATPLAEGAHSVTAVTSDGMGGLLTSNTNTFTIDTSAPAAPVVLSPADGSTTADTTPTVTGTAEPLSTVTIFIDGMAAGTTTADASGAFTFDVPTALSGGTHTVSATSEDRAGNASPSSNVNTFTIGATTGPTVVTPADGSRTRDTTPTLSGTATPGATVEARVDGQVVCTTTAMASGAWACTPTAALAEGPHAAAATEQGSTATSNTNAFVIDSVAPAAPVIVTPADGATTDATPTLSGTAEPGARVTIRIDGAEVCVTLADAQGRWSCVPGTALTDGTHTVTATATDAAGNVSPPATPHTFIVGSSNTPPSVPVLVTPADGEKVSSTTPTLSGTAEPGTIVTVSVDGQPVCSARADATGHFACAPVSALSPGPHRASAVATNAAGATSPTSNVNTFIVPGGEPAAPTIISPAQGAVTNDSTPTITGTAEPGSTVTVREGATVLCTATADASGAWSCDAPTLPDGTHGITATASNAGGEGPASTQRDFTVDTTGPTTTITKGPGASTRDTTGTFEFEADEAGSTFECSLDGAPFVACRSPAVLNGLSNGPHVLEVRATDAAGNVGPAARYEWTVTARPVGEFSGGCSCATVEPSSVLAAVGLLLVVRRRRRQAAGGIRVAQARLRRSA
ncbi:MAG: Ig-like domain-containing protein [Myxococcota bacterium]